MGAIQYRREDHTLAVRRSGDGLQAVLDGNPIATSAAATEAAVADMVNGLVSAAALPIKPADQEGVLQRLVLEIPRSLAAIPWEQQVKSFAGGRLVVRLAAGRPSVSGPLQPPVRVLQVTSGKPTVPSLIEGAISAARPRFPGVSAVEAAAAAPGPTAPAELLRTLGWSTVDLLHLDGALADPPWPAAPGQMGSLGWLEQLVHLAQCRLLVLEPGPRADQGPIRAVADRLARRGGPAVIVPAPADPSLGLFYRDILNDVPVDAAAARLSAAMVIGGAGREEAISVSAIAGELVGERDAVLRAAPEAAEELAGLTADWHAHTFGVSDQLTLYPVAARLYQLRRHMPRPTPPPTAERSVLAALYSGDDPVEATPLRPLRRGERYDLRIEVGIREEDNVPPGAAPLLFERRIWDAAPDGLWLEVGVTGIGWEILDEPVQRLFVPRTGPSLPCWFAVRPVDDGAPLLRYTIFHNGHVVQSYRLAALVGAAAAELGDAALARVLDLPGTQVTGRTWVSRLEYATVAQVTEPAPLQPRAITIVANDAGGRSVVSIKAGEEFAVRIPADLDRVVQAVRDQLKTISFNPAIGTYRFGTDDDPNAGAPDWFADPVLPRLAKVGGQLFDAIFPLEVQQALPPLGGSPCTVQVAQVLRDKVVPWALVYQGAYDPDRRKDNNGQPVGHAVCTALLDPADPAAAQADCTALPTCLLHPDRVADRAARGAPHLRSDTVACPGRFWGFRHRIEVPPQQVPADEKVTPVADEIRAARGAAVTLAVSPELKPAEEHHATLRAAVINAHHQLAHDVSDRDDLLDALGDANLDLVYVYCTANGAEAGPYPPELLFAAGGEDSPGEPVAITTAVLEKVIWHHRPLVVLNGCGTAGFSPRAVSAFITAFVDDRKAAALLGTEVAVAEVMAREVGETFLREFLAGAEAGDALLASRRALLLRYNPLGLVYTLYGVSELRLTGVARGER